MASERPLPRGPQALHDAPLAGHRRDLAIVGYPGCSAWITAGLLELFAIANNARPTLPDGRGAAAAAAGTAYMHLALELVRELAGEPLAAATGRLMLVERRRGSQSPFLVPHAAPEQGSAIERATRYRRQHSAERLAITGACRALAVSERTLARRFKATLGMSPLSYLQSQRVARARQLLESSKLSLDRIVEQCGYADVSSFRKLFARQVGMTPRDYRQRFGNG